ncbi:hypothetical protein N0V82_002966 [Gnomoniopsis sp. IMI 355080]|nr:hypothetical protein N0V82_002966 [Gnomoniopsis sp. IMI 355080]
MAPVRRTISEQQGGHKPQIRIRKTTFVYQKPSTGQFAKYSVNKVISFSNK